MISRPHAFGESSVNQPRMALYTINLIYQYIPLPKSWYIYRLYRQSLRVEN